MKHKLALFSSGSGSNAENIVRYFAEKKEIEVSLIISNKADAFVHQRAQRLGVPSFTFTPQQFREGTGLLQLLRENNVDFIVLAGFLLKVSAPLLQAFPSRIVNIHPALLPKFGGKGMYGDRVHQAVVEAGETESGISIHYVNEHYDEGQIIFQARCQVLPEDSFHEVAEKVHALEYEHFPRVIAEVLEAVG